MDFLTCMQQKHLLDNGEYIIISVDDEIYNPEKEKLFSTGKIIE